MIILKEERQLSDNFWRWFGNSKVVDENGEPLVCYHGTHTAKNFYSFKTISKKEIGSHFGSLNAANKFVMKSKNKSIPNARIIPVYLRIENPLETPDIYGDKQTRVFDAFRTMVKNGKLPNDASWQKVLSVYQEIDKNASFNWSNGKKSEHHYIWDYNGVTQYSWLSPEYAIQLFNSIKDYLESLGYDGIKYKNEVEDKGSISYIAFHPNQIKSAIGNSGMYDISRDEIAESTISCTELKKECKHDNT